MSNPTNYSGAKNTLKVIGVILTLFLFLGSISLLFATLDSYQSRNLVVASYSSYLFYLPMVLLTILFGSMTAFAGRSLAISQIILMVILTLAAAVVAESAASSGQGDSYGTMFLIFAGPGVFGVLIGLVIFVFKHGKRTAI